MMTGAMCASGVAQQVVQRGALGRPAQVLDQTGDWTTPLMLAGDKDVEIYLPDVSNPDWLRANYTDFVNKGQYVATLFTFYRTTTACQANQIGWGNGDQAHLDACVDIGYRVREATVDVNLKTVTLIYAAMVGQDGMIVPDSVMRQVVTRRWADLDANTRAALDKATVIVAKQMSRYDQRLGSTQ